MRKEKKNYFFLPNYDSGLLHNVLILWKFTDPEIQLLIELF